MQVALNDEATEYTGGRLVFATGDGFVVPPRPPGTATIHTHDTVHGVTTLRSGVRYSLFLCATVGAGPMHDNTSAGDTRRESHACVAIGMRVGVVVVQSEELSCPLVVVSSTGVVYSRSKFMFDSLVLSQ